MGFQVPSKVRCFSKIAERETEIEKKNKTLRPQNAIIFVSAMITGDVMSCDMAVSVEGC